MLSALSCLNLLYVFIHSVRPLMLLGTCYVPGSVPGAAYTVKKKRNAESQRSTIQLPHLMCVVAEAWTSEVNYLRSYSSFSNRADHLFEQ